MLAWWRIRRERARQLADALIAQHADQAYEVARWHRIRTLGGPEHRFWCAVAQAVANRTGRRAAMDTATRYLDESPDPAPAQDVLSRGHS